MTLNCIPAKHRFHAPCDKPANWYVWYEGCGGVYTAHCNEHLAESLLDDTVRVVQIDSIARVQQYGQDVMSRAVLR